MNQSTKQAVLVTTSFLVIVTTISSMSYAINDLPNPSWLSKSPLKCMPDNHWWQSFEEQNIKKTQPQSTTTISFDHLDTLYKATPHHKQAAQFTVIVFDPWVPWEVNLHYLKNVPCHHSCAFFTVRSVDQNNDTANTLIISHESINDIITIELPMIASANKLSAETIAQAYLAALKAAAYSGAHELFLTLIDDRADLIGAALNQPAFKEIMQEFGVRVTLIYTPDLQHRTVKMDLALFDPLLDLFDCMNKTHYHTDRPIRFFVYNYLTIAYQYEAEKVTGTLKTDTLAGLHHISEQINILLKKMA